MFYDGPGGVLARSGSCPDRKGSIFLSGAKDDGPIRSQPGFQLITAIPAGVFDNMGGVT